MDWFRHYHGCVTDPKHKLVARASGQALNDCRVVWDFLMEFASQADERGRLDGCTAELAGAALDMDEDVCAKIMEAYKSKGLIDDRNVLVAWAKRQPKSDNAAERMRKWRERERDSSVTDTPPSRNGPVTVRECDAERREEQSRIEKKEDGARAPAPSAPSNGHDPAKYAFVGPERMRVTHEQFGQWAKAFPYLALRAKLQQRADWYATQGDVPKGWFIATSNWLGTENDKAKKRDGPAPNRSELPL